MDRLLETVVQSRRRLQSLDSDGGASDEEIQELQAFVTELDAKIQNWEQSVSALRTARENRGTADETAAVAAAEQAGQESEQALRSLQERLEPHP